MQIISAADFPLFCSNSARKSSILCGIRTPLKTPLPKSCQTLVLYYLCKLAGCTLNVQLIGIKCFRASKLVMAAPRNVTTMVKLRPISSLVDSMTKTIMAGLKAITKDYTWSQHSRRERRNLPISRPLHR